MAPRRMVIRSPNAAPVTGWLAAGLYGLLSASGLLSACGRIVAADAASVIAAVTAVGVGLLIAAASLYLISAALMAVSAMMAVSGACRRRRFRLLIWCSRVGRLRHRRGAASACANRVKARCPAAAWPSQRTLLTPCPRHYHRRGTAGSTKASPRFALLGAFALANFAEGLSSSAGMRDAGRSPPLLLLLWIGATGLVAAPVPGFALFSGGHVENGWLGGFAAGSPDRRWWSKRRRLERSTATRVSLACWQCWDSRRCCWRL